MTTQAENFAKTLEARFGSNFRHAAIDDADMIGVEGSPKATLWDSFGDIEVVKFADGSTYEPTEIQFCKPANA